MRTLPKFVVERRSGFVVRIVRGKTVNRAYVPHGAKGSRDADLDMVIKIRDEMAMKIGPVRVEPKSNTGFVGITETIKWVRYRPRHCFYVFLSRKSTRKGPSMKRIYYGAKRSRAEALRMAISLRKENCA